MKFKHSFTLIELLVVIAVIAILAGILLPALKGAQDMVRQTTCISNNKQIGILTSYYINDFNGFTPPFRVEGVTFQANALDNAYTWYELLNDYLTKDNMNYSGKRKVLSVQYQLVYYGRPGTDWKRYIIQKSVMLWRCPEDREPRPSYKINAQRETDHYYSSEFIGYKIEAFKYPSQLHQTGETNTVDRFCWRNYPYFQFQHRNKMTILLSDGHVEMKNPQQTGTILVNIPGISTNGADRYVNGKLWFHQ